MSSMLSAFYALLTGQLATIASLLWNAWKSREARRKEQLEQVFGRVFDMTNVALTEVYFLSSRNPTSDVTAADEMETNEYLERVWRVTRSVDEMCLFAKLLVPDQKLEKTSDAIRELASSGYEQVSKRDATGFNIIKACIERMRVYLFQLRKGIDGRISQRDVQRQLGELKKRYEDGYIPKDTLEKLLK